MFSKSVTYWNAARIIYLKIVERKKKKWSGEAATIAAIDGTLDA
jgi:hypothetical protein